MTTREQTQAKLDRLSAGMMKHTPEQHYTVADRLEERAAASPDSPFLLWNGRALSYGEVNAQANRFAHHALASGCARATWRHC